MTETPNKQPADVLKPGNIIELADIRELVMFEDIIAAEVEPYYDKVLWAGRQPIGELIRPKKPVVFNGTIANIHLEVMDEPYERLLDARQRGWKIPGRGIFQLTSRFAGELIPRYRGFRLTAEPKSSKPGILGQIQAELWYYPVPLYGKNKNSGRGRHGNHGETIKRRATEPKMEKEKFIEHDKVARIMGSSLLREAMRGPYSSRDF
ncbi:MAG TPA: hypothetical protein VLF90_02845 [Patescibacteria group bacterium]|nr:hypothetical protein [Patescibacteria group bacterium]